MSQQDRTNQLIPCFSMAHRSNHPRFVGVQKCLAAHARNTRGSSGPIDGRIAPPAPLWPRPGSKTTVRVCKCPLVEDAYKQEKTVCFTVRSSVLTLGFFPFKIKSSHSLYRHGAILGTPPEWPNPDGVASLCWIPIQIE